MVIIIVSNMITNCVYIYMPKFITRYLDLLVHRWVTHPWLIKYQSEYPLVMTNSSPWSRWPIEMLYPTYSELSRYHVHIHDYLGVLDSRVDRATPWGCRTPAGLLNSSHGDFLSISEWRKTWWSVKISDDHWRLEEFHWYFWCCYPS